MSKFKRTLAMLIAVVMVICALPMTVAADENDKTNAIEVSKNYDQKTGWLTLTAYATGESQVIEKTEPIDVVLVLDTSGSMNDGMDGYSPTYDVSYSIWGHESYYYLKDGEYKYVHHCLFCGWCESSHGVISHPNDRLTPKTSATSGGTQFYRNKSKLDALKDASTNFIDIVAKTSPESNIAIVDFASESNVVKELTSVAEADSLITAINGLESVGATRSDLGMSEAQKILGKATSGHKKVVIMFTDGVPTTQSTFSNTVANSAINTSSILKSNSTTVYTIGCFDEVDCSEKANANEWGRLSDINKYMNLVSSNFGAGATRMTSTFDGNYKYGGYYKTASNSEELKDVFKTISEEIGGTSVTLNSDAVLKDFVTDDFTIAEDVNNVKAVEAYTETCTGFDTASGKYTWQRMSDDVDLTPTINRETSTVEVTGFDYSANWVGKHGNVYGGKRIVVKIKIDDKGTGMGVVPTNTEDSGIYKDKDATDPTIKFEIPKAEFPYYTVKHVQNNAVVKTEDYRVTKEKASLTDKVSEGYLYGGTFKDKTGYTDPYKFKAGENGISFTPDAGEVYCIWEVSNKYLSPRTYSLWIHVSPKTVDVTDFYFMTAVDRLYYKEVGFVVTDPKNVDGEIVDISVADKGSKLESGSGYVYKSLTAEFNNGTKQTIDINNFQVPNGGYFACHKVSDSYWKNLGTEFTFHPYWVTLDGVTVSGAYERTCSYKGPGDDSNVEFKRVGRVGDKDTLIEKNTPELASVSENTMLVLMSSAKISNVETAPVDPITPVEPSNPVSTTYTVNVVDGDDTYSFEVDEDNDGIKLEYAGVDGKIFAGWYINGNPTDLSVISSDVTVEAKYVSDDYLCTKYIEQGLFRVYGMTLISSLDTSNYADAGFIINGKEISCDFSESYGAFTARALFGNGVARKAKLMTYSLSLRNAANGDKFEVIPYWVTLDGTTVYGTTRVFVYNSRGITG